MQRVLNYQVLVAMGRPLMLVVGSSIELSASFPYNPWKVNYTRYAILFEVAQDVMAIPMSTVASKSAFSTWGHVLDPFRSSLAPKTVEALICAQN